VEIRRGINSTSGLACARWPPSCSVCPTSVAKLLRPLGFSLKTNIKRLIGKPHPQRDKQYRFIQRVKAQFMRHNQPVISVDAKKTELIGNFKNSGTRYCRQADSGGNNGHRPRMWKYELQQLCNDTGLSITVCHYPSGASKWNPIEHRLFSQISRNWAGQPLRTLDIILGYIRGTTTSTGLKVGAVLDERVYEKGITISQKEMSRLNITRQCQRFGDWAPRVCQGQAEGAHLGASCTLVAAMNLPCSSAVRYLRFPSIVNSSSITCSLLQKFYRKATVFQVENSGEKCDHFQAIHVIRSDALTQTPCLCNAPVCPAPH